MCTKDPFDFAVPNKTRKDQLKETLPEIAETKHRASFTENVVRL
jgi:hypothetical protein